MKSLFTQGPVFVCFFWALRNMCNLPVESMTTGGMYWFTDLTLPDQYYLLPLITSSTLFATLQVLILYIYLFIFNFKSSNY